MLQESLKAKWLTAFHDKEMRTVLEEIRDLWATIMHIAAGEEPEIRRAVTVYKTAYFRNIRMLMAYMRYRLIKIRELRWKIGRPVDIPADNMDKLHDTEKTYFERYNDAIDSYMKSVFEPDHKLDITLFAEPLEENKIEVRVLKGDGNEILTANSGVLLIEEGSTFTAYASDIDALIRSGHLEKVVTNIHN